MRITNWKTHVKFIGAIIAAVVIVFYASGQFDAPAPAQPIAATKRPILIQEASWGLNCAKETEERIANLKQHASSATGEVYDNLSKEIESLKPIPTRNNALELVKGLCAGQSPCTLDFSEESIPYEPNDFCSQELSISYLCHSYDVLRDAKMSPDDEPLVLDCSEASINPEKKSE